MARIFGLWRDITEGQSLHQLWTEFKGEARSSLASSTPELPAGASLLRGWRRWWEVARVLFFRLSPARRVLLLLAIVLLLNYRADSGQSGASASGGLFVAAFCFLVLLALEVADRVSLKRDLELARDIQSWLLPRTAPTLAGIDIAFTTRPANTVAGDYYDAIARSPGRVLVTVADVAGKGIPAGLLMACFRTRLHTLAGEAVDLASLAGRLNQEGCGDQSAGSRFTTAFLAELDAGTHSLEYVNAGHNPPLLRRRGGAIECLDIGGLPLGAFPQASYQSGKLSMSPGDTLLIYTDGVVEAVNEGGEEYGMDRLRTFVASVPQSAAECVSRLLASLDSFTGKVRQSDDITCLAVLAGEEWCAAPLPP